MRIPVHINSAQLCLLCALVLLSGATTAAATPITVNLRVEGSTKTLYEGPISVEPIEPPGIATEATKGSTYPCDVKYNGGNEGYGSVGVTPTAALYDAARSQNLAFDATWYGEKTNDFDVEEVGEDIANSGGNGEYWGYAVDYTTAEVGGCQIRLAPGSEVLWAYNFFNLPHLLKLSGPGSVDSGTPFTVHAVDGQTGQPIAGAAIGQLVGGLTETNGSSPITNAAGEASVVLTRLGTTTLKATAPESVRSNGLAVCVHNGNDGTCGTTVANGGPEIISPPPRFTPTPDLPRVAGVANGHVYKRHSAPRILEGSVVVPTGETLHELRLSLQRRKGGRCFVFDGRRAAFTRAKCSRRLFFKVADTTSYSYLLPARLPAGRYVYEIEAVNDAGVVTKPVAGVSRVTFDVK